MFNEGDVLGTMVKNGIVKVAVVVRVTKAQAILDTGDRINRDSGKEIGSSSWWRPLSYYGTAEEIEAKNTLIRQAKKTEEEKRQAHLTALYERALASIREPYENRRLLSQMPGYEIWGMNIVTDDEGAVFCVWHTEKTQELDWEKASDQIAEGVYDSNYPPIFTEYRVDPTLFAYDGSGSGYRRIINKSTARGKSELSALASALRTEYRA